MADGAQYGTFACLDEHTALLPDDEFPEVLAVPHMLVKYDNIVSAYYTEEVPTNVVFLGV
jgi:hypothetical protein